MKNTRLDIKWGVSRGRETYGYGICTFTDVQTGKKYRAMGGGYDMRGASFGEWATDALQTDLLALCTGVDAKAFYGLKYYSDDERAVMDGAAGFDEVVKAVNACGYSVRYLRHGRNSEIIGLEIEKMEAAK